MNYKDYLPIKTKKRRKTMDELVDRLIKTRDTVLVSLCLLGIPCRYHGEMYRMGHRIGRPKHIIKLMDKYNILPLCGEQIGGLPTPRPPCKVSGDRVVTKDDTQDFTDEYRRGAALIFECCQYHNIKRAYLLKNSPMCGRDGILGKLLNENGITVITI
jgi:uncharacterized protein YbbK (DUF523 family)